VINYNVMGVAKAALEATVRYLAVDLGNRGMRINAISAGPVQTLAARGIRDFSLLYKIHPQIAPSKKPTTIEDVGGAGVFLCSSLSEGMTGEVIYVDGGFHNVAVGPTDAYNC
jgi:enoyl-[acyl-carrier protein] reductase I